jgi:hypothetical protein
VAHLGRVLVGRRGRWKARRGSSALAAAAAENSGEVGQSRAMRGREGFHGAPREV